MDWGALIDDEVGQLEQEADQPQPIAPAALPTQAQTKQPTQQSPQPQQDIPRRRVRFEGKLYEFQGAEWDDEKVGTYLRQNVVEPRKMRDTETTAEYKQRMGRKDTSPTPSASARDAAILAGRQQAAEPSPAATQAAAAQTPTQAATEAAPPPAKRMSSMELLGAAYGGQQAAMKPQQAAQPQATASEPQDVEAAMSGIDAVLSDRNKSMAEVADKLAGALSSNVPLGIGEHMFAAKVPPDMRPLMLDALRRRYASDKTMQKAGYGTRLATSAVQGAIDFARPLAKMFGALPSLDPDQERFRQEMLAVRQEVDPTVRPDTPTLGRWTQQAAQMTFPMVQSISAGGATGGAAGLLGAGAKTTAGAVALGTSGSFLPQIADDTYTQLIGEGVNPDDAKLVTAIAAPIEAAVESFMPDPFKGMSGALRGTARQVAKKVAAEALKRYGKELSEEIVQGGVREVGSVVASQMDEMVPDKGYGSVFMKSLEAGIESAGPLAIMMAPGGARLGMDGIATRSRKTRLDKLKAVRAKGSVSRTDAKNLGLPPDASTNQTTRKTAVEEEIKQLEQEIQNAESVASGVSTYPSRGASTGAVGSVPGQTGVPVTDQNGDTKDVQTPGQAGTPVVDPTATPPAVPPTVTQQAQEQPAGQEGEGDVAQPAPQDVRAQEQEFLNSLFDEAITKQGGTAAEPEAGDVPAAPAAPAAPDVAQEQEQAFLDEIEEKVKAEATAPDVAPAELTDEQRAMFGLDEDVGQGEQGDQGPEAAEPAWQDANPPRQYAGPELVGEGVSPQAGQALEAALAAIRYRAQNGKKADKDLAAESRRIIYQEQGPVPLAERQQFAERVVSEFEAEVRDRAASGVPIDQGTWKRHFGKLPAAPEAPEAAPPPESSTTAPTVPYKEKRTKRTIGNQQKTVAIRTFTGTTSEEYDAFLDSRSEVEGVTMRQKPSHPMWKDPDGGNMKWASYEYVVEDQPDKETPVATETPQPDADDVQKKIVDAGYGFLPGLPRGRWVKRNRQGNAGKDVTPLEVSRATGIPVESLDAIGKKSQARAFPETEESTPPSPKPELAPDTARIQAEKEAKESAKREQQERVTSEGYAKLPEKSRTKFEAAWDGDDAQAMKALLDTSNKALRAEFERRTGVKLPRTIKGMKEAVDQVYAGRKSATPSPKPAEAKPNRLEIYPTTIKGESYFAVHMGHPRGAGDPLFKTQAEAESEVERVKLQDADVEKRRAAEAEREKTEAAVKADRDDIDGFEAEATPMRRGKVIATLNRKVRSKGKVITRKEYIRDAVKRGAIIKTVDGEERVALFDGTVERSGGGKEENVEYYLSDITKIELEYAKYLIGKRDAAPSKPAEAPVAKQPWEMTQAEYIAFRREQRAGTRVGPTGTFEYPDFTDKQIEDIKREHKHEVRIAESNRAALGVGPSDKVLADYPDLKPKPPVAPDQQEDTGMMRAPKAMSGGSKEDVGKMVSRAQEIKGTAQSEAIRRLKTMSVSDLDEMDIAELDKLLADVMNGPGNLAKTMNFGKQDFVDKLTEYLSPKPHAPAAPTVTPPAAETKPKEKSKGLRPTPVSLRGQYGLPGMESEAANKERDELVERLKKELDPIIDDIEAKAAKELFDKAAAREYAEAQREALANLEKTAMRQMEEDGEADINKMDFPSASLFTTASGAARRIDSARDEIIAEQLDAIMETAVGDLKKYRDFAVGDYVWDSQEGRSVRIDGFEFYDGKVAARGVAHDRRGGPDVDVKEITLTDLEKQEPESVKDAKLQAILDGVPSVVDEETLDDWDMNYPAATSVLRQAYIESDDPAKYRGRYLVWDARRGQPKEVREIIQTRAGRKQEVRELVAPEPVANAEAAPAAKPAESQVEQASTSAERSRMMADIGFWAGTGRMNPDAEQRLMDLLGVDSMAKVPPALKAAELDVLKQANQIAVDDKAQQEKRASKPAAATEPATPTDTNPWAGASVEDESRWYGTRVDVAGDGQRSGAFKGTVMRVLNGGDLVEVKPDDADTTWRVASSRVTIRDIKDAKAPQKRPPWTKPAIRRYGTKDTRANYEQAAELRDKEREYRKKRDAVEKELAGTRRNAKNKRREIQNRIDHWRQMENEQAKRARELEREAEIGTAENHADEAKTEAEFHAWMLERDNLLTSQAGDMDQREIARRHKAEAEKHADALRSIIADEARKYESELNPDEFSGLIDHVVRDYRPARGQTVEEAVSKWVGTIKGNRQSLQQELRSRKQPQYGQAAESAPYAKWTDLSDAEREAAIAEADEAAKTRDWHGKFKDIRARLDKQQVDASTVRAEQAKVEAEAAAVERAKAEVEQQKEHRSKAAERGKEERFWKQLKAEAKAIKGTKGKYVISRGEGDKAERVEVTGEIMPDGIIGLNEETTWDELKRKKVKQINLTHIPTGVAFASATNVNNAKELVALIGKAGIDWTTLPRTYEGFQNATGDLKDTLQRLGRIQTAWGDSNLGALREADRDAMLATVAAKQTTVQADIVLDADDLGVTTKIMQGVQDKSVGIIKNLATEVPEFAYDPVFRVEHVKPKTGKGGQPGLRLVFRDGYKFSFAPEMFNLHPGELTEGMLIGINLEDLGIARKTEQDVVADILRDTGFSKPSKRKDGTITAVDRSGLKVELVQDAKDKTKWTVKGKGAVAERASQALERIRWTQPGQTEPGKGSKGPPIGAMRTKDIPWKIGPEPKRKGDPNELGITEKEQKKRQSALDERIAKQKQYIVMPDTRWDDLRKKGYGFIPGENGGRWVHGYDRYDITEMAEKMAVDPTFEPDFNEAKIEDIAKETEIDVDVLKTMADRANRNFLGIKEPDAGGPPADATQAAKKRGSKSKAAEAHAELNAALDEAAAIVKNATVPLGLDPKLIPAFIRVARATVKAGTYDFRVFIENIVADVELGRQVALDYAQQLREIWEEVRAKFPKLSPSSDVAEILAEKPVVEPSEAAPVEPAAPPVEEPATAKPAPAPDGETTGTKNVKTDELRAKAGLGERVMEEPESVEEWQNVRPMSPELTEELAETPRNLSPREEAALNKRIRTLENRRQAGEDVQDELLTAIEASERVGRLWGQAGVSRQAELDRDFTVTGIVRQHIRSVGERPTAEQMAEIEKQAAKIKELEDQLKAAQEKAAEEAAKQAVADAVEETKKPTKTPPSKGKVDAAKERAKKAAANVKEKFKALFGIGISPDPTMANEREFLKAVVEAIRAYVDLARVQTFTGFRSWLKSETGVDVDKADTLIRQAWDQEVGDGTIEVPEVDSSNNEEVSRLAQQILREVVKFGITETDAAIDAVHAELQNSIPDITREEARDAASGYGNFRPLPQDEVSQIVRRIKGESQQTAKIETLQRAIVRAKELLNQGKTQDEVAAILAKEELYPKSTGIERREIKDIEAQLIKEVNRLKKEMPVTAKDKAGRLKSALGAAKTAAQNRLRDLGVEIAALEKSIADKTPLKKPIGPTPLTPDADLANAREKVAKRRQERDDLKAEYEKLFPTTKKPTTEAQRIAAAIRALDRVIAQMEADMAAGKLEGKAKGLKLDSPELAARRARLQELRDQRDELRENDPAYQAKVQESRVAAREKELDKQIAKLEADLAAGNLAGQAAKVGATSPEIEAKKKTLAELRERRKKARETDSAYQAEEEVKRTARYKRSLDKRMEFWDKRLADAKKGKLPEKRKPTPVDKEILGQKAKIIEKKTEALNKIFQIKREMRPKIQKIAELIPEVLNTSRAVMTAFDLSAVLRQGGVLSAAHPMISRRAFVPMLEAFGSEHGQAKATAMIVALPSAELAKQAGLDITTNEDSLNKMEEAYMSRLAEKIPGVSHSGRAYMTFLNVQRALVFDSLVRNLGRNGEVTLAGAKILANWVNIGSGRGNMGRAQAAASSLATVFFAPRYVLSRFQLLGFQPLWTGLLKGETEWRARRLIAQEYGRTAAGLATFYATFAMMAAFLYGDDDDDKPTITFDWRSSDFGKLKFGETRIDPLAGLSQATVLLGREITGKTVTVSGEVKSIRGDDREYTDPTMLDVFGRFMRSKLSPFVGTAINVGTGENVVGEKVTVAKGLKNLIIPLIVEDIYDAMRANGVTDGTTIAILSILGMSSQTYGPKTEYRDADAAGRKEQFENDLESMKWNSPPPAYAEFLTADQMKQVDARREEKKRSVIEGATQNPPDRKKHISDATYNDSLKKREKSLETFKAMKETVSFEQAKQLLKDYYRYQKVSADGRPLGSIIDKDSKYGNVKPEYLARMRLLRRLYGQ